MEKMPQTVAYIKAVFTEYAFYAFKYFIDDALA